ncbi:MAG: hypothetical protein K2W82_16490 [Candidatus Obscuribacterales bacterium]|nr:hypothetical protein [Candidatus Obscuribacterales bacterium]
MGLRSASEAQTDRDDGLFRGEGAYRAPFNAAAHTAAEDGGGTGHGPARRRLDDCGSDGKD